jgi:hypothetical protein
MGSYEALFSCIQKQNKTIYFKIITVNKFFIK